MPYAYRKSERLRKNTDFIAAMKGKRLSIDGLSLFYTGNDRANFRVGIAVGKKLAKAAARNRLRRRIRSSVMEALAGHALGFDLVFVARRELCTADFEQIARAVKTVLARSLFRNQKPEGTRP